MCSIMEDLSSLVNTIEQRGDNVELMEISRQELEDAINYLTTMLETNPSINQLIVHLSAIFQILVNDIRKLRVNPCFQKTVVKNGKVGRPKISISAELLVELKNLDFTWTEISSMLMVSRWTIQRRVKELGLSESVDYSDITDDELDNHVKAAKERYGILSGRSMVIGYLKSLGLRIQRQRVIKSLIRIDPDNSNIHWACLIKRRKYSVPGPNSLWHADGHHSLIRWGFVIHGAIDGFSRLIVYLKCSSNNKSETVLENFNEAIEKYGIPSRLRTDKGGENVLLWETMERLRGYGRGSYIAGSSVHNQRIERLWRDVWTYAAHEFYYAFQSLEAEGFIFSSLLV